MLRIIGGSLSGRKFEAPKLHRTHPMGERVKLGLFNALGDISGLTVLDAFAGSGALAFEALSRDAASAIAIELDPRVYKTLQQNTESLGLEESLKTIRANCAGWSNNNPDVQFDLVIAAPPYVNLQENTLQKLARHVRPGGLYILDWPGGKELPDFEGLERSSEKSYGDAQLAFYRKQ